MPYTSNEIWDKRNELDFKFNNLNWNGTKSAIKHLMKDEIIKGEYLGACLDHVRWGGQTTVMYAVNTFELMDFIQHWINLNKDNLIWNNKPLPEKFSLPYINHEFCPNNKEHKGTIMDLGGRLRCANISKQILYGEIYSYNFFDKESNMFKTGYSEKNSEVDFEEITETNDEILNQKKHQIDDICYAILSDKGNILSLEKVLNRLNLLPRYNRVYCYNFNNCKKKNGLSKEDKEFYGELNLCPGHQVENNEVVHPFDGWTFARYIQKWYEQVPDGKAPVFEKKKN